MVKKNNSLNQNSPGYEIIKAIANYMESNFDIKLRDIQIFTQILKDSTSSKIREETKEPKLKDRHFFYGVISNLLDQIGRRDIFTCRFLNRIDYFKRNIILTYICACDAKLMRNFGKNYFQNLMSKVTLSISDKKKKEEILNTLANLQDQWDRKIDILQEIITNSRSVQSSMKINEDISADNFSFGDDEIFDTSSYESYFL